MEVHLMGVFLILEASQPCGTFWQWGGAQIMVSTGKPANTIAERYARLRAKADEEAREAGHWPRRKGPESVGPTIAERYARLRAKADQERLDAAGLEWITALLTPTGKRRRREGGRQTPGRQMPATPTNFSVKLSAKGRL